MNATKMCLNREEKLQLALFAISNTSKDPDSFDEDIRCLAERYLVAYIVEESGLEGIDIENISKRSGEIIADFILSRLVKKGVAEVTLNDDGQFNYKLIK